MSMAIDVSALHAWYGESHVLHGVDLQVRTGQMVTLLGRNGAGRSTTLRATLGLLDRRTGSIQINGVETITLPPYRIARLGTGYCPEERGIFASLTCEENLLLPPVIDPTPGQAMPLGEIYGLFPNLRAHRHAPGSHLSGGEQQMLAIARILRTGARTLLLDEISEGLAPVIVQALGHAIRTLKDRGYTILLAEQNFHFAAPLADDFVVMQQGRVIDQFPASQLASRRAQLEQLLGIQAEHPA